MEILKGLIFDRGPNKINNEDVHTYLVSYVLITNKPLTNLAEHGETVITNFSQFSELTDIMENSKKYEPPHCLGDLSSAMIIVSNLNPLDLHPTNAPTTAKPQKPKKKKK